MKISLKGASRLALALGTAGVTPAFAQQTQASPQTVTTAQTAPQASTTQTTAAQTDPDKPAPAADKVVVTGSLIAVTPENSPKPVEVFTADDLRQQGTPNVTEFIRSLTTSYGDDLGFGQASPDVPQGTGFGNANLRGLGSNGTLVLMNGKNLAPWNGAYGADVNTVPMEALQSVEVLKDGASATYGAGAVGGVINFRTRRDIDAPQVSVEKQFYDGSDGYYKADFLTGWVGDSSNLLVSLSYQHEDPMLQTARKFSSLPFNINPAAYTLTAANPGIFQPTTSDFYGAATITMNALTSYPGINDYRTTADCTAVGGVIANQAQPNAVATGSTVANTGCAVPQYYFQNLVNENDQYRSYIEFNTDMTDHMEFHFDTSYSHSKTIQNQIPIGPASPTAIDRTFSALCGGCNYVLPVQVQSYTTAGVGTGTFTQNPFIADFRNRVGAAADLTALPANAALYMGLNWRPFMFGGNPITDGGLKQDTFERDSFIVNIGVKGDFAEGTLLGSILPGVAYDLSAQYNQYLNTYKQPDVFASRLQNAMLGYGGPSCNAVDRVATDYTSAAAYNRTVGIQSNIAPGTQGCQWFNPFASAWATSVANGAANPQFNAGTIAGRASGYANPKDLIDWMYGDRIAEYRLESITANGQLSGEIPGFELPGGKIGWGLGFQSRQVEGRSTTRDDTELEENMATQPCVWPDRAVVNSPAQVEPGVGTRGCSSAAGAFFSNGRVNIVVTIPPYWYDQQTAAAFAEFQLPVLDNLNFQASFRHEEYNGGALIGDIYSLAGKWDITDNLYFRASYGTNYRADGALELDPGSQSVATTTYTRFGTTYQAQRYTNVATGIGPENDKTFNAGFGWQSSLGEGRIRASVDFFEVFIDGQVATTSDTTILNNIFGLNTTAGQATQIGIIRTQTGNNALPQAGTGSSAQYANCSASLISFVNFSTACTPGVTTAAQLQDVLRYQLNGPGFITNGLDFTFDIAYPMFGGTTAFQVQATQNLVYKAHGYSVNGILFDPGGDRLGQANYTGSGNESREWRANAVLRWANGTHNMSVRANYSSGTYNEAYTLGGLTAMIADNPTTTTVNETAYSTYGIFPKEYLDFDLNYIYTAPFWKDLELRATVLNVFDKDPSPAQGRSGYYNATGNPRGRIFEVGLTKKF